MRRSFVYLVPAVLFAFLATGFGGGPEAIFPLAVSRCERETASGN